MELGYRLSKSLFDADRDGASALYTLMAEVANKNCWMVAENEEEYFLAPIPQPSQEEAIRHEIKTLKAYLTETDWMVVKCLENGLAMSYEYPMVHAQRQAARTRINELEEQLNVVEFLK